MSILERIQQETTAAMKGHREAELSTLRLLRAALKNRQIELLRELSDEDVLAIVRSQIKQIKDAIVSFEAGQRADLIEKAKAEIKVLEHYLPAPLSQEELVTIVRTALEAAGLSKKTDKGKAMGIAMKALAGRADGTQIKEVVETCLA